MSQMNRECQGRAEAAGLIGGSSSFRQRPPIAAARRPHWFPPVSAGRAAQRRCGSPGMRRRDGRNGPGLVSGIAEPDSSLRLPDGGPRQPRARAPQDVSLQPGRDGMRVGFLGRRYGLGRTGNRFARRDGSAYGRSGRREDDLCRRMGWREREKGDSTYGPAECMRPATESACETGVFGRSDGRKADDGGGVTGRRSGVAFMRRRFDLGWHGSFSRSSEARSGFRSLGTGWRWRRAPATPGWRWRRCSSRAGSTCRGPEVERLTVDSDCPGVDDDRKIAAAVAVAGDRGARTRTGDAGEPGGSVRREHDEGVTIENESVYVSFGAVVPTANRAGAREYLESDSGLGRGRARRKRAVC